jgi:hypothetical protein
MEMPGGDVEEDGEECAVTLKTARFNEGDSSFRHTSSGPPKHLPLPGG